MLAGRRQLSLDESNKRRLRRQASEVRPILAWQDSLTDPINLDKQTSQVEVVAKKIGQPKPTPTRPIRSPSTRPESCLALSRRQVAERLRVGWSKSVAKEGKDKGRQNLNIFLNKSFESRPESPKTPELGNEGYRRPQYFLQDHQDEKEGFSDSSSDTDSSEDEPTIAVLDPPAKPQSCRPLQTPPPPRQPPLSASARRAVFKATGRQKPTTISSPEPRPRLMSAPPQPPARPLSAERSRSAPPRRLRRGAKTKPRRGVEGGEVVTMVSLVSPAESEEEEVIPGGLQCPPTPEVPPSPDRVPISNPPPPPLLSLRRPPKAVTFKSGAAEGPQFRTSYPVRAATILQEAPEESKTDEKSKEEKRSPETEKPTAHKTLSKPNPQPRITKALKPTLQRATTIQERREEAKKKPVVTKNPEPIKEEIATEIVQKIETLKMLEDKGKATPPPEEAEDEGNAEGDPDFKSAKEKECWQLFKRVSSRGVSVSFETVLRGLLTPTEYRMRKAALLSGC